MTIRPRTERDVRSGSMKVRLYQLDRGSHQRTSPPPVVTGDVRGERNIGERVQRVGRSADAAVRSWVHVFVGAARVVNRRDVESVSLPTTCCETGTLGSSKSRWSRNRPGFMLGSRLRDSNERGTSVRLGADRFRSAHSTRPSGRMERFHKDSSQDSPRRRSRREDESLEFERTAETPHGSPSKLER